MAYEINYNLYAQDLSDNAIVIIPNLQLDTNYKRIIYTLTAPSYISKDFLEVFFIGGAFDTDSTYKPIVNNPLRMSYTKLRGGKANMVVSQYTIVMIKRGDSFSFKYKDAAQYLLSEL